MSQICAMNQYAVSVDEMITYSEAPNVELGRLDLGSADVILTITPSGEKALIIMTSSGHAAVLPAAFFRFMR